MENCVPEPPPKSHNPVKMLILSYKSGREIRLPHTFSAHTHDPKTRHDLAEAAHLPDVGR